MQEHDNPIPDWTRQDLPPMLSRRFEFESYSATRAFLDNVAKIAESVKHYPNLSFGKTYVSVTLDEGGSKIGSESVALAQKIDALLLNEGK
ncbi:4a-hydroxytetrahydrobiopterin dehydratase [Halothiobacillus sp.]|jgi:pterin-4a-carbinolamine dehydratase|uniref:4a-hydroxytetrahydrobiopterin dehydratase n=1 Tax=Halothiobacillus sp. TaxID=1891311 RepID=UPI00261EF8FC|nr:4a-hydroxytetrahydrobiopterin dehydratase [Halothiobacillus sp.]MDD3575397.1 4a-hydroxytetrahydrobiopterin dehydratase [Halothiobacillus sp.]MDD4967074.1 4a-hydroxytetrahydrobiopterin dehydratase [Halothiobacillus sp.]MDY0146954.1 4a-hydroxytetrahydrobiopterin dehydratase [Halothiobacillus sp.]